MTNKTLSPFFLLANLVRKKTGNVVFSIFTRLFSNSDLVENYHSLLRQVDKQSLSHDDLKRDILISQNNLLERLILKTKCNKKINVLFIVFFKEHWGSMESLYQLYRHDKKYSVAIITVPRVTLKSPSEFEYAKENFEYFDNKKYIVYSGYDPLKKQCIDIKKQFDPDLIFLGSPWDHAVPLPFQNQELSKIALTCYFPYSYVIANLKEWHFNHPFHKYCWKIFYPTPSHLEIAKEYGSWHPDQMVSLGYPKFDQYRINKNDPWKLPRKTGKKRIIWAPHWTLLGEHKHANSMFLELYQYFINLIQTNDNIELTLKPHPGLWDNLIAHKLMTESQIKDLKRLFEEARNSQIYEGSEYFSYFMNSDCLILDSVSFMAEYLPTDKPIIFTGSEQTHQFNEIGTDIFSSLYKAKSKSELNELISSVIFEENDPLKNSRRLLVKKYQMKGKSLVSYKIKRYIENISNNRSEKKYEA